MFEARSLRVQIPCGSVTVVEAERLEAEAQAHKYWLNIFTRRLTSPSPCCARGTDDPCKISEDLTAITERVCMGTNPLELRTVVDANALPILKEQLEARLSEINAAIEAVAQARGGG